MCGRKRVGGGASLEPEAEKTPPPSARSASPARRPREALRATAPPALGTTYARAPSARLGERPDAVVGATSAPSAPVVARRVPARSPRRVAARPPVATPRRLPANAGAKLAAAIDGRSNGTVPVDARLLLPERDRQAPSGRVPGGVTSQRRRPLEAAVGDHEDIVSQVQEVVAAIRKRVTTAPAQERAFGLLEITESCGPHRSTASARRRRPLPVGVDGALSGWAQLEETARSAEHVQEAMAELQSFRFEDNLGDKALLAAASPRGAQYTGKVPWSPRSSAASTMVRHARPCLGTSSAATISPPSPQSPAASSQADGLVPPSEMSALGGAWRTIIGSPSSSLMDSSSQVVPAMERATRSRREARLERRPDKVHDNGFSDEFFREAGMDTSDAMHARQFEGQRPQAEIDEFDGMHLTPLQDQPFQALSSIARQAHSVLLERVTPRGGGELL